MPAGDPVSTIVLLTKELIPEHVGNSQGIRIEYEVASGSL
jgi:hypothetical protein